MKITLFIFAIILNGVSLFYLPKVMEKRTYLIVYGIVLGSALFLNICAYVANPILEKRVVKTAVAPPSNVPVNKKMYSSVREHIAQSGSNLAAVANELPDALLEQAIISLGEGNHSAVEIALRVDDLACGKVKIAPPLLKTQPQHTTLIKVLQFALILFIALVAIVLIGLTVHGIMPAMFDMIISFHYKYNIANINRQPIKFFIGNRDTILTVISYIFFFGSFLVFYGLIFRTKI